MFEVVFEVKPRASKWEMYLDIAKHLKPELEQIGGFFGNIRYKSLTRPGWLLSLSDWVDEKALIRWRTHLKHHEAQEKGREEVFEDYHLRVGEVFSDTGFTVYKNMGTSIQTRFDMTEVGMAKTLTLMEANFDESTAAIGEPGSERAGKSLASKIFHFNPGNSHPDLVSWDIFEAVSTPGVFLLLCAWSGSDAATHFTTSTNKWVQRIRQVRIIRDYSIADRREAPQFYPALSNRKYIDGYSNDIPR